MPTIDDIKTSIKGTLKTLATPKSTSESGELSPINDVFDIAKESIINISKNYQFNEITNQVSSQIYKKNKYRVSIKNKYNNYEYYNNYDMEEDSWTSLKAS